MTALPMIANAYDPELETRVMKWRPDPTQPVVITTDGEMQVVAAELLVIVGLREEVARTFDGSIKRWHDGHKAEIAEKKRHDDPLASAEQMRRVALSRYRTEQERRALEQRRADEEAARKLEEEQRLLEVGAALAAGDEGAAEEIIQRPINPPPPIVPIAKAAGVSFREVWDFEVTSLHELEKHCAAHPEDANLCKPNDAAIRAKLTSQKTGFKVPGIRVWSNKNVAATRR